MPTKSERIHHFVIVTQPTWTSKKGIPQLFAHRGKTEKNQCELL